MLFCSNSKNKPVFNGFHQVDLEDGRIVWTWARGYFFDESKEMWVDEEIIGWLLNQLKHKGLTEIIPLMNGAFSFAIYWVDENKLEVGIDRFGCFPIYYYEDGQNIYLGEEYWQIIIRLPSIQYNPEAVMAMVLLGHVSGNQTLVLGVDELSPACLHTITFSDSKLTLNNQRYWRYSSLSGEDLNIDEWQRETTDLIDRVFSRISKAINKRGWSVSVPLSSGHDSRLILGMLARSDVRLSAFSYGPTGNQEGQLASQLARALSVDYQFTPVDDPSIINPQLINLMTNRVGMKTRFTTGLGGQLSLNSHSNNIVYMPGHPGNLPTGSAFERGFNLIRSEDQMLQHQLNNMSLPLLDEMAGELFTSYWNPRVRFRAISGGWDYDPSDPIGSYVRWGWEVHVRGLLLLEMRTYDEFGHWILPYCDYELVDFFAQVPYRYLYKRSVFIQSLLEDIYVKDLKSLAEIPIADRGTIENPQLSWKDQLLLKMSPSIAGDYILRRATQSKYKEWQQSRYLIPQRPTDPDPIDYWWHHDNEFRGSVIDILSDWDGMGGIVDTQALKRILTQPLPLKFIRYSIPSIITLCVFQNIVENNRQSINNQSE